MKPADIRNVIWVGEPGITFGEGETKTTALEEVACETNGFWNLLSRHWESDNQPLEGQVAISVAASLLSRCLASIPMPQDRATVTQGVLTFIQRQIQEGVNAQVRAAPGLHKRPPLIKARPGEPL